MWALWKVQDEWERDKEEVEYIALTAQRRCAPSVVLGGPLLATSAAAVVSEGSARASARWGRGCVP